MMVARYEVPGSHEKQGPSLSGPVGLCDGFRAFFGGSARVQVKKRFVLGFSGDWEQRSAEAFERSLSLGQFAEVKG